MFDIYLNPESVTVKKLNQWENDITFRNQLQQKMTMALNRYRIDEVPETCNERVILQSLLLYGCVEIFDRSGSLLSLPAAPAGDGVNVYGDFTRTRVYAKNGILNEETTVYTPGGDKTPFLRRTNNYRTSPAKAQGVLIWENPQRFPFMNYVLYYARIIADTYRTLDIVRKNLKSPYIIVAEESVVNSVRQFFKKRANNEEIIVDSGVFPVDKVKLLPFDTQADSVTVLTGLIDWYEGRFRELCDIKSNANIDKKGENLIQGELDINDEAQAVSVDESLKEIQKGLDLCNEFFGTNMQVKANREEETENGNYDLYGDDSDGEGDLPGER